MNESTANLVFDPFLFEMDFNDMEDIPDEDIYEHMAWLNTPPEDLVDPKDRAAYILYLEAYKPEAK